MKLNVLVLAATAMAAPASKLVVHESRGVSHGSFAKGGAVDADARVPVKIALKQRNLENAMDLLMKVSDPKSADYGKHYSKEQVVSTFAPDAKSVEEVKAWLVANGIPADSIKQSDNKGWLNFETTAGKLESLLNAKYSTYTHPRRGDYIGTEEYKLPSHIAEHVDFVHPAVSFGAHGSMALPKVPFRPLSPSTAMATKPCGDAVTPDCLRKMYNFDKSTLSDPSNDLGIYEEAVEQVNPPDLQKFYPKYASYVPKNTLPKTINFNGKASRQDSGEANLDFMMAVPIIYPQGTVQYLANKEGDRPNSSFIEPFLEGLDSSYCGTKGDDCGTAKATNVISISYGDDEALYELKYLQRRCNEWMKLGLQGTSVLISSGDSGVASRFENCLNDGTTFVPGSLVSCPYVTAVGATQLPDGGSATDTETATMEVFSSGGGFSNVMAAPDYQKSALETYFSTHDPGYATYNTTDNPTAKGVTGVYNRIGRGYPDVAANGLNGVVFVDGQEGTSGGTSQAAPIFAAVITRIINERIKAGKKGPLGFLNPALYQNPDMFNDITSGDQHLGGPGWGGDGQPSACGNNGFSAVEGWDPVTGLGTPNYPKMLNVLGKL
ncbi:hypothetical protein NLG97_g8059 [Lecanicillium saksenae]|uniref:Uncharacterized protein n=1 Tax=Lecanicillium saksenae TaxID=468837 RepID=A0ACC1QLK9_9HYPO|nr:hypothetical protein NLG97_g8059 [Lecanicillium saksenae]